MQNFNPNRESLFSCIARIQAMTRSHDLDPGRIITSQDVADMGLEGELNVQNVPDGFTKSMLPVYLDKASTFWISHGKAGTEVPEHSHDEGSGLRVILDGSIRYRDKELKAGDWMFLPAGTAYSFTVGERGASMFYCYSCCCA